ncbi:hypothetical protein [Actinophytocola sp.]|uniref:hypothetical protein n=1 Tax=Actinophytocola sp. TaxID=1872138 RepID=UPI003D6B358C
MTSPPRSASPPPTGVLGGIEPNAYRQAEQAGRLSQDIPVNQPTLDTGTQALVVAALAWLAR